MLALIIIGLASCTSQDVAPIDSPDDNPTATITARGDVSSITEGDTLWFDIVVDAFVANDIDFGVTVLDGSELTLHRDYEVIGSPTLRAYTDSANIGIVILDDGHPEIAEATNFEVSAASDYAWNWQLSPASTQFEITSTVESVNLADTVAVGVEWDDDGDDWDFAVYDADSAYYDGVESGANPEVIYRLFAEDAPDGDYYVTVFPWDVSNDVSDLYTSVVKLNGDAEVVTTTVDLNAEMDDIGGYIVLATITKSGSTITVTGR